MIKKILVFLLLGLFVVQNSFALDTYIGLTISDLKDDASSSCAGQAGYGTKGRMRAISSIQPGLPLYFEVRYNINDTLIWSGNSVDDTDYEIGDTIFIPQALALVSSMDYKVMMDVDAIRVYLPLENYMDFEATVDDNYWTAGKTPNVDSYTNEYFARSSVCVTGGSGIYSTQQARYGYSQMGNARDSATLMSECSNDGTVHNCDQLGLIFITNLYSNGNFKIDLKYNGLHNSTAGNMNFVFNMP